MGLRISEDVRLRLLEESDASELQALIEANRDALAPWLRWAAGQTLSDTVEFIRQTRLQALENRGFQTAVDASGRIAGVVGFTNVDWQHRTASIGYWLDQGHQGRGTMTQAVRALVGHAFEVWALHRVEIRAAAANHRSRAIPERLGFRPEGTLRDAECVGGRYLDSVVYAILATEWPPAAGRT